MEADAALQHRKYLESNCIQESVIDYIISLNQGTRWYSLAAKLLYFVTQIIMILTICFCAAWQYQHYNSLLQDQVQERFWFLDINGIITEEYFGYQYVISANLMFLFAVLIYSMDYILLAFLSQTSFKHKFMVYWFRDLNSDAVAYHLHYGHWPSNRWLLQRFWFPQDNSVVHLFKNELLTESNPQRFFDILLRNYARAPKRLMCNTILFLLVLFCDLDSYTAITKYGIEKRGYISSEILRKPWDNVILVETGCQYYNGKNWREKDFYYRLVFNLSEKIDLFDTIKGPKFFENLRYIDQQMRKQHTKFKHTMISQYCYDRVKDMYPETAAEIVKLMRETAP